MPIPHRIPRLGRITIALSFALLSAAFAQSDRTDTRLSQRRPNPSEISVFVELDDSPVVTTARSRSGPQLAEAALSARTRAARLQQKQEALATTLSGFGARVSARFTRVSNGLRVRIPEDQVDRLASLPGVRRVQPVRLYSRHLATSTPFVGTPTVWATPTTGVDGRGLRIGIIDSGIDYHHADFGGSGKVADFTANDPTRLEPGTFPTTKVVGGFDFAGDAYNPNDDAHENPIPDNDPLDCAANGHGTHVAGIAAGYGVLADGSTYRGDYTLDLDFARFSIAPGVAPNASLYALKIFGCDGSTALVTDALEWAADPNGDYDFSDRLDVVNLSLGGDFGTLDPEDSDLAAANRLAQLGTIVVCSAGNSENIFFAVGAPGVADRAISVANSISKGRGKALAVLGPPSVAGNYFMVEGGLTPALTNAGPVTGRLVYSDPPLACEPFANAAAVRGNIALIDRGVCFFANKILNAQNAGAIAVVVVNNLDGAPIPMGGESAGIRIPGIMISKADGALLKERLGEGVTVRLDAETSIIRTEFVDTLDDGSSRGPASPTSALKPEISAPGSNIESAKAGSGSGAISQSGTSMSAPMVTGAAALLRQIHRDWPVDHIKAALMNAARPIRSPEGAAYPESRMGAGRLQLAEAARATVSILADDDTGRVGVSFGSWIVASPREDRRTVRLVNHSDRPETFRVTFSNSVVQAGLRFVPGDNSVTVPPRGIATTSVRLIADPHSLDLVPDATTPAVIGGGTPVPRHFLYEASGQLWFHNDSQSLHLPCYVNARAGSDYRLPDTTWRLPSRDSTKIRPELTLRFLGDSSPTNLFPIVSAFELGETSPDKNLADPNRSAVDLLAVGVATDVASVPSFDDSFLYFGLATAGAWSTPQPALMEFDVFIDVNKDGFEDYGIYNGNAASTNTGGAKDAFMSVVVELDSGFNVISTNSVAYLNYYAADEWDTAVFNNSVMVLPVPVGAIGLSRSASSFRYRVRTFTQSGSVDRTSWIPFDAARPVIDTAFSSPDGTPMHDDGFPLTVRLDREAARESGRRLPKVLLLHHSGPSDSRFEIATLDLENDDTDNDGLPDWWEQRYFSGIGVAGPDTDTDGDGASDRAELASGTHPNDSRSAFRMRSASRVSNRNISVRWTGIAGQVFTLERSTNLLYGFTEVVRDNIESTPPLNSITDTNAPDPGPYFYRVKLKP